MDDRLVILLVFLACAEPEAQVQGSISPVVVQPALVAPGSPPPIVDWFPQDTLEVFEAGLHRADPAVLQLLPQIDQTWTNPVPRPSLPIDPWSRFPKATCDAILAAARSGQVSAESLLVGCDSPELVTALESEFSLDTAANWYTYHGHPGRKSPRLERAVLETPSWSVNWGAINLDPDAMLPVYQAAYQRHADPTIRQDLASAIGTYDTPEAQAVCQLHFPACNPWHGRSRWLVIGPPFHAQAWLAAHPERAPELETAATRCIDDYLAYIEPHAHNCLEVLALTNWPEAQRRAEVLKSTSAAESIRGIAAGLKRFPSADSFRAHVLTLGLVNTPVQAVSAENALFENQRSIWPQDEEGEVRIERLASLSEGLLEARFERRTLGGELVIEAWFRGEHWRVQDSFASEPWVSIGLLNAMTKRNKSTDRFALTSQGMVVVAPEMALRAADAEEILPLQRRIPAESVSVIPVPPEY